MFGETVTESRCEYRVFCQGWVVPVEWSTGWVCDYQIDKAEPGQSS